MARPIERRPFSGRISSGPKKIKPPSRVTKTVRNLIERFRNRGRLGKL